MRYLSVCSGIEAATVAWHPLGWEPVAFSEIEPFPCAVLAHHYPTVPNLGDMTTIRDSEVFRGSAPSLLVGGTPCQAFSVAGLRKGLADPRGNLALVFLGLADAARPRWVVWENVPGVLSSNGGRDFGAFLGALGELGYGWAYRVLDAQFFGLAQRRKRVFVVGYLGDWRRAAAVLFERSCLSGHPAPSREAGQGVAGTLGASLEKCGTVQDAYQSQLIAHTLRGEGFDASEDGTGRGIPLIARALTAHNQRFDGTVETLVFDPTQITSGENRSNPQPGAPCHTLPAHGAPPVVTGITLHGSDGTANAASYTDLTGALRARTPGGIENSSTTAVQHGAGVRRLTPRECERLQGFPDDYTLVPYGRLRRKKMAADGPRYKAIGNSKAVPVVNWIGARIALVDALTPA